MVKYLRPPHRFCVELHIVRCAFETFKELQITSIKYIIPLVIFNLCRLTIQIFNSEYFSLIRMKYVRNKKAKTVFVGNFYVPINTII